MGFGNAKAERPYTKTIKWRSSEDRFEYYDGEGNQPIEVESFIPLEEMVSVSGYSKERKKGIWSNEILDLNDKLEVRVGNEIEVSGKWSDIKAEVSGMGGKFTNVVIVLMPDGEIVRFLLSGSGCSGWIGKRFSPMQRQCGVLFDGSQKEKSGSVTFNVPIFMPQKLDDEQVAKALESWKVVNAWLEENNNARNEHNQETEEDQNQEHHAYDQALPADEANARFQEAASTHVDEVPF